MLTSCSDVAYALCSPLCIAHIASPREYPDSRATWSHAAALKICSPHTSVKERLFLGTPVKIPPRYPGYAQLGLRSGSAGPSYHLAAGAAGSVDVMPFSSSSLKKPCPIALHMFPQYLPCHRGQSCEMHGHALVGPKPPEAHSEPIPPPCPVLLWSVCSHKHIISEPTERDCPLP